MRNKMADNRLFSPPGEVAMGNALSSRMSRPNLLCIHKYSGTKSHSKNNYLELYSNNSFKVLNAVLHMNCCIQIYVK